MRVCRNPKYDCLDHNVQGNLKRFVGHVVFCFAFASLLFLRWLAQDFEE